MLNLNKRYIKIIQDILLKHIPNSTVWAYGSRVTGQSHEGSDLDLVVFSETEACEEKLTVLREAFADSQLPISIDILDWNVIPNTFKQEIEKEHITLQEAKKV